MSFACLVRWGRQNDADPLLPSSSHRGGVLGAGTFPRDDCSWASDVGQVPETPDPPMPEEIR